MPACIDDQKFPFSFVTMHGTAKIYPYKQKEVLEWATIIAERYVGKKMPRLMGRCSTCTNKAYKSNCRKRYFYFRLEIISTYKFCNND